MIGRRRPLDEASVGGGDLGGARQGGVDEPLIDAARRGVGMPFAGVQAEHRSQGIGELAAVVAADRQPTASLGSVQGEGGDDQSAPGGHRPQDKAD